MIGALQIGAILRTGMNSSIRDDWRTPREVFHFLQREFLFDVDICASAENALCPTFITAEQNALDFDWSKWSTVWMNPPYGRHISHWIRKAYETGRAGSTVVCLLPSRTDTSWWHRYCMSGEIRFLRGRLNFDNRARKARCPFPSAIVIFRGAK